MYIKKHKNFLSRKRSIVLICSIDNYKEVVEEFAINPNSEFLVQAIGIFPENIDFDLNSYRNIPIYNNEEKLLAAMLTGWVDEVFVSIPNGYPMPDKLIDTCKIMGITVRIKIARVNADGETQVVEQIEANTVISSSIYDASIWAHIAKRLLDICGGVVGIFITGLLTVVIGPIIKIKSPGPIFFSQMRLGKNGKPFKLYKFRSMYIDAENSKASLMTQNNIEDGLMFKVDDDPRIIEGIGHFIRNYSLDEFPQFWNVLKGDMSLVGTRPPLISEVEQYDYSYRFRLSIKPGITGMWQTSGRSDITDFGEVVKLDKEYIERWSLGLDLKLIAKTVLVVIKKEGSK